MKKLLPVLAFVFASLNVCAQAWSPFTPGVNRYFTNSNNYLHGMRIDSVINYGNDVHYYPFRTARWPSYLPLGSWLGFEVIEKPDGRFLFPNYWNDTISLKPFAAVADSWLFFQDDGNKYYNATVTAIDTMTILGSLDSIKRIVINAYNNGQPLLTDSFDNAEIILSKANGFYAIIDLYFFPYHQPDTTLIPYDYYFLHSLQAIDLPQVCPTYVSIDTLLGPARCIFRQIEFVNPTSASMHDWDIGDVLEYSSCWISHGTINGCTIPWTYSLDTILAKNISSAGVEYVTSGWRAGVDSIYWFNNALYNIGPYSDTIFYSSIDYLFPPDFMPEEYILYSSDPFYFYFPGDTDYCNYGDKYYTCWDACGISWVQAYRIEKSGIGLVHYNKFDGSQGSDVNDSTLVYFVRNGQPCGTFVLPDTSMPVGIGYLGNEKIFLKLYPNPAAELVTIETMLSNYTISLMSAIGQVVYAKLGSNGKQQIDVSHLVNGVYYLKIETQDHQVISRKVTIN